MVVNEKNKKYFVYTHNEVCIKLTMEGSVREKNFKYVTNCMFIILYRHLL